MENRHVELAEDLLLESISSKGTDYREKWLGNAQDVESNLPGLTQALSTATGGQTSWTPPVANATFLMSPLGTSLAL